MERASRRVWRLAAAIGTALAVGGCTQGNLLLTRASFEPPAVEASRARAGIQGVPRLESNKYQAMLEAQIARGIDASGLFASVAHGDFDPQQVDLLIRIEPAIAAWDRRGNLAYLPLALATLTLYIWVGGPILTDTEFYDVTLRVHDTERHLFDVSVHRKYTHWINFYSGEYWDNMPCQGPRAGEMVAELVRKLGERLASAGWERSGHRTSRARPR
jgi:hypothetical protein